MPAWLRLIPGTTIRWQGRRFVIVDYAGFEAIVAREIGKRRLHRVPLDEVLVDLAPGDRNAWTPDLTATREKAWQTAVRRFKILKPLIELDQPKRTFAEVKKIAHALRKHLHHAFFYDAAPLGVERLTVLSLKKRLRQTSRCRVVNRMISAVGIVNAHIIRER